MEATATEFDGHLLKIERAHRIKNRPMLGAYPLEAIEDAKIRKRRLAGEIRWRRDRRARPMPASVSCASSWNGPGIVG